MIINLDIEAEPDLCAWLLKELARRRESLAAMGSGCTEFGFDDAITGILWDAYERSPEPQTVRVVGA